MQLRQARWLLDPVREEQHPHHQNAERKLSQRPRKGRQKAVFEVENNRNSKYRKEKFMNEKLK